MHNKTPAILVYLVLLLLASPVPLLHHYRTDRAIERMRPAIKMADGGYAPMLMPADILFLRWLGQLSQVVPFAVLAAFLFSFWRDAFAQPAALLAIAIFQCAFTTLYALYSTLLLGSEWLRAAA